MARYIKANPLVAKFLHLEDVRNTVKDGNYLLWQADMQFFGPLSLLPATLEQIGGIVLTPHEAREEQDGTVTRPLPVATDSRFVPLVAPAAETEPAAAPAASGEEPQPEEPAGEEGQETGGEYETPEYATEPEESGEEQTEEQPEVETPSNEEEE